MPGYPVAANPVYNKPVYNAETKSYFELYSPDADRGDGPVKTWGAINWTRANSMASARTYKGVPGRLAIVKTPETHDFLRDNFHLRGAAWIGLRFWCRFHKLQWVDGSFHTRTEFSPWGRVWNSGGGSPNNRSGHATCPKTDPKAFLSVHYWGEEGGYIWNAQGGAKEFNAMFIEYPTGGP